MPDVTLAAIGAPGASVRTKDVLRLPVAPEHCTVNGSRVKASEASWTGLDFARAEDCGPYLSCPWMHPEDHKILAGDPDYWARYRVRSRYEPGRRYRFTMDGKPRFRTVRSVAFERQGEAWWIVLGLAP